MNLAEIYAALDTGQAAAPRFAAVEAFAARTALALLTRIVGLPLAAIHLPPPEISVCFPQHTIPPDAAQVFGRDIGRYRSWRRLVLDTQLLGTGSPVDADPWQSLRRIARLTRGEECARSLYTLKQQLPAFSPAQVTFERVLRVSKALTGHRSQAFRRALAVFDMLHGEELAQQSGLLPPRMPQLPKTRRGPDVSLPPRLARLAERGGRQQENAARTCWALAVAAGISSGHGDPSPASAFDAAAWSRLCAVDPGQLGVRISPETFAAYRERFAQMLVSAGSADPRRSPVSEAWTALNRAVRQAGFRADALSPIAAPAKAARLRPQDVTPGWIGDLLGRAMGAGNDKGVRSACYLLDDLRSEQRVASDLLPPTPTGITRRPRRTAKPKEEAREASG